MGAARPRLAYAALLAALLGCGPSGGEPIVRFATCGADGPVEVLPFDEDSAVATRLGTDRLLVQATPLASSETEHSYEDRITWSVGPCGETPVQVATGLEVSEVGEWLLGCGGPPSDFGPIVRVDPEGQAAPVVLLESAGCEAVLTDHGLLAFDRAAGELRLHRDPSRDELVAEVLATDIAWFDRVCLLNGAGCDPAAAIAGPAVYAVTGGRELVRIDLATGATGVIAQGAAFAWMTPDTTHLWWREASGGDDEPGDLGPVHLRDLATDADVVVYDGTAPREREWPYGHVELRGANAPTLLDLRDGTLHGLPEGIRFLGGRTDAPMLLWGDDDRSYYWSEVTLEAVEIPRERPCYSREWGSIGFDELRVDDCDAHEGDLWTYPYDGGPAEPVATNVTRGEFLHFDGKVVWSTERSVFGYGDLFVATEPGERTRIAAHARLQAYPRKDLGGDVLYVDGDRSGLWRTATEPHG